MCHSPIYTQDWMPVLDYITVIHAAKSKSVCKIICRANKEAFYTRHQTSGQLKRQEEVTFRAMKMCLSVPVFQHDCRGKSQTRRGV